MGSYSSTATTMEESSAPETQKQFHISDDPNPQNDHASQKPQSGETLEEAVKPLSPSEKIHDADDDGVDWEYENALGDEIRQVIYMESLNEAVINLALQENARGVSEGSDDGDTSGDVEVEQSNDLTGRSYNNYNNRRQSLFPIRMDAEDCSFYVKTGNCKFGMNCKFNHPPKKRNQVSRDRSKARAEDSERSAQTQCKYYLTSGGCKYGNACKYIHGRERSVVSPIVEFNFLGLPIRLGERECPYYMRNGSCKYGSNCKFNHPDPTPAAGNDMASGYANIGSMHGAAQSADISWSSSPVILPQSPGIPSTPDWNGYQTASYTTSEMSLPTPPAFAMNNPAIETNLYTHHQLQMPADEFPQRPGQADCSYFMRTGDCKYKSNCRFHHPKLQSSKPPTPCALSDKGLPLRPDQSICSFYNRYGICKFGPACKFDHPENWGKPLSSDGMGMPGSEMEAGFS